MAAGDLVFEYAQVDVPAHLVFGDVPDPPGRDVTVDLTFPLTVRAQIGPRIEVVVDIAFPLTLSSEVGFSSNTDRPLVGHVQSPHQNAIATIIGRQDQAQTASRRHAGRAVAHQTAVRLPSGALSAFERAASRYGPATRVRHQTADRAGTWSVRDRHQDGLRDRRTSAAAVHQNAVPTGNRWHTDWQDRHRDRRPSVSGAWQEGTAVFKTLADATQSAAPCVVTLRAKHQEAVVPSPGVRPVVPPVTEPCYLPDPDLVFYEPFGVYNNLIFVCDGEIIQEPGVVVPVRSVYVVINNISLKRVSDNTVLNTFGMSLSIDADSWTWGFSASLPATHLDAVMPDSNGPVELEASINGTLYRVLAESISRERSFGRDSIRVGGRGKSALLASPYSPVLTFSNSISRTAQQLMADVLTFNAVPIGWDIDWQIDDWLVPGGVFNQRGSYIEGLLAIAGAAGAYLQPHPVSQEISVLHRYPTVPWEWGSVTPDFELPSAVTTRESIEWVEKPEYNRVYVSGVSSGVLARVTRTGTAGDLAAQMVTDPLITQAAAGRQRGIAVLGDTGRQANVTLRLPVLAETGVIGPGKFVRYVDGLVERVGIVRSTSVDAAFPSVFQTIRVETHV